MKVKQFADACTTIEQAVKDIKEAVVNLPKVAPVDPVSGLPPRFKPNTPLPPGAIHIYQDAFDWYWTPDGKTNIHVFFTGTWWRSTCTVATNAARTLDLPLDLAEREEAWTDERLEQYYLNVVRCHPDFELAPWLGYDPHCGVAKHVGLDNLRRWKHGWICRRIPAQAKPAPYTVNAVDAFCRRWGQCASLAKAESQPCCGCADHEPDEPEPVGVCSNHGCASQHDDKCFDDGSHFDPARCTSRVTAKPAPESVEARLKRAGAHTIREVLAVSKDGQIECGLNEGKVDVHAYGLTLKDAEATLMAATGKDGNSLRSYCGYGCAVTDAQDAEIARLAARLERIMYQLLGERNHHRFALETKDAALDERNATIREQAEEIKRLNVIALQAIDCSACKLTTEIEQLTARLDATLKSREMWRKSSVENAGEIGRLRELTVEMHDDIGKRDDEIGRLRALLEEDDEIINDLLPLPSEYESARSRLARNKAE